MSIGLGDDLAALAETVSRWCADAVGVGGRRLGIDGDADPVPPHWDAMVALGWPGLHLPETHGGQGYGLAELAVVLEETGRAGVPGPLVTTTIASAVIDRLGSDDQRAEYLPELATGTIASIALPRQPFRATTDGPDLVVTGTAPAVLSANGAELVIVPIAVDDVTTWAVIECGLLDIGEPTGVDLTRAVARVTAVGCRVPSARQLQGDPRIPTRLAALLLSCEAVGIGAWCVETAAGYAADRRQFGRPIGQFQGVKHRCADMLAALELARAAVWDACRGGEADEEALAIGVAAALAPDTAVRLAKDTIQVLGGVGFTWEHDAHLYLRRATASRALLPPAHTWHDQLVAAVGAGTTRRLPVDLPDEAEEIRAEVAAWLSELTEQPKSDWNRILADAGYLTPHWPEPWGRGATAVEQMVIDQEFAAAGVRRPHLQVAAWALPTLILHGTPEQQARWVPASLRFEISWCQLFSEPEAGSDLASLRMRAERADGGWTLTGQKVWTSMAQSADWGICLARTSPDKPNHQGITCFFVDMSSDGIDIRPLREINGDAWFNEVFFDGVFVPDDCVIGEVDDGWRAGRTTLANERVSMGSGASIGAGVTAVVNLAGRMEADPVTLDRVGHLVATDAALHALRTRMTLRAVSGADAGPEASVVKLLGVIHDQDVQEVGLELLGDVAATGTGEADGWVRSFLWNRCLTIAGGTSEVQRNVIAERLLGLPRDP